MKRTIYESVNVIDANQTARDIAVSDCAFSYRDSVFKARLAASDHALIVLSVTFRLPLRANVNLEYAELAEAFELDVAKAGKQRRHAPAPLQVAAAVKAIRRKKLPDPDEYANAGSFFKNPVIDARTAQFASSVSDTVSTAQGYKVSAAQLMDLAG